MKPNLLSEDELAALSEGVRDGSIETDTGFNTRVRVRKHDLASEDSSLGVNVSAVDMINERFIRLFRLGLLEVLRSSPRVNPTRVQIMKFGDYLKGLRPPLSVNIVRMHPLRGNSVIIIDPNVVFSSLDSFFGGFGKGVGEDRGQRDDEKEAEERQRAGNEQPPHPRGFADGTAHGLELPLTV